MKAPEADAFTIGAPWIKLNAAPSHNIIIMNGCVDDGLFRELPLVFNAEAGLLQSVSKPRGAFVIGISTLSPEQ